jgi:hypothetical protein
MSGETSSPEDVEEALRILEEVLSMPSTRESDTRTKRRVRVEVKRLLGQGRED